MTAEGTFPKVDGDILYASEVNNFGRRVYLSNENMASIGSSTNGLSVGSFVIPANSLSSTSNMFNAIWSSVAQSGTVILNLSGTDFGANISSNASTTPFIQNVIGKFEGYTRSGLGGAILYRWINTGGAAPVSYDLNTFFGACYPNSGLVVNVKLIHNAITSGTLQGFTMLWDRYQ